MTQAALAFAAGTRERNIIRWENDQNEPRLENIAALAQATGKEISFFLTADESADDEEESDLATDLMAILRKHFITRSEFEQARHR